MAIPFLSYRFEQAGDYLLEIRDVRYQGNADWVYSIEISSRPLVTNVHPTGAVRGGETGLRLLGAGLSADAAATLSLPADAPLGPRWVQLPLGDSLSNPVCLSRQRCASSGRRQR